MAEMVWCNSCKTVVWAYDHQKRCNLGGLLNELDIPCPKCGNQRNFDGWGGDTEEELEELKQTPGETIYDWWSAMKSVAHFYGVEWEPSPDNRWFNHPRTKEEDYRFLLIDIKALILRET